MRKGPFHPDGSCRDRSAMLCVHHIRVILVVVGEGSVYRPTPARGGAGGAWTGRSPSLSAGALRSEARAEATGRATHAPRVWLSAGANTYAGCPHAVAGPRRPAGGQGV